MSATATQLADTPARNRLPAAPVPTIALAISASAGAVAAHRYSLPVVREIQLPPADHAGDRTW
jgi:hypothetical protein